MGFSFKKKITLVVVCCPLYVFYVSRHSLYSSVRTYSLNNLIYFGLKRVPEYIVGIWSRDLNGGQLLQVFRIPTKHLFINRNNLTFLFDMSIDWHNA